MTGEELKDALTLLGISQKEFAELVSYSEGTVSRWIRGHRPIEKVVELAVGKLLADRERSTAVP